MAIEHLVLNELREGKLKAIRVEVSAGTESKWSFAPLEIDAVATVKVVFPGAFHPIHQGHRTMAVVAAHRLNVPVEFEISTVNVDKTPLDDSAIADRLAQFQPGQRVWLTQAATFAEKAKLFPHAVFIVGADTIKRIADPNYYDNDPAECAASIREIAEQDCRFLVFGRLCTDAFDTLGDIKLPHELAVICDGVSENDFRFDVSSSELRSRQ